MLRRARHFLSNIEQTSQRSVNPTNNYCANLKTTDSNGRTAATSPSSSSLGRIFNAASVVFAMVESSILGDRGRRSLYVSAGRGMASGESENTYELPGVSSGGCLYVYVPIIILGPRGATVAMSD
eukprot:scaffold132982_cov40-Cyclotella_meneghiniana.AAC.1